MCDQFAIQNYEFLECAAQVDPSKETSLYRFLESIITGKARKDVIDKNLEILKKIGVNEYLKFLRENISEKETVSSPKRKNIKDGMIENYVIKNKKDRKFLQDLNFKIFLKIIPTKNIKIQNGNIVDILVDD